MAFEQVGETERCNLYGQQPAAVVLRCSPCSPQALPNTRLEQGIHTCAHLVLLGLAATLLGRLHLLLILICSLVHLQAGMPSPGESVGGPGGPVQPVSRVVQPSSSSQLASREPRELTLPAVARRTGVASCILVSILTEQHAPLKPAVPCFSNSAPTSPLTLQVHLMRGQQAHYMCEDCKPRLAASGQFPMQHPCPWYMARSPVIMQGMLAKTNDTTNP